jgi:hypothetical protein
MPMLAGVGLLVVCCSSASAAAMMMGGGEEKEDPVVPKTPAEIAAAAAAAAAAATPSMLKCLDTRARLAKGWTQHPRAAHTEAEARALCTGKKYMSLECPTKDGYEVWCADDISDMPVLADAECMGTTSDTTLNGGKNGGCDAGGGAYLSTEGLNMGGWHRGSLYAI